MGLNSTRANFDKDFASIADGIGGILKNPDDNNTISTAKGRVHKILDNQEYNAIPGIRNAFDALHELDRELASLAGVFTYGGSIGKADLETITKLMKNAKDAVPSAEPQKKTEADQTTILIEKSRVAIREHRYDDALTFLSSIPDSNTRIQRIYGLAQSIITQRESRIKNKEKSPNDAAERTTIGKLFNKLLERTPPDFDLFNKLYIHMPNESKLDALIEITKLKMTKEEFDALKKESPPTETKHEFFARLNRHNFQRDLLNG